MTVLHWVRHGPTHARTMIGWTDMPADLSDTARLARLSAFLPDAVPLLSSDLTRAVTTADALETPRRPRQPHRAALRELHFGDWEDRTFAEVTARHPARIAAFWKNPGPTLAPGGESWDILSARVGAVADDFAARGQDAIIVAHFGAILTQIQRARGQGPAQAFAQPVEPLSVTRLRWDGRVWHAELVNHCP